MTVLILSFVWCGALRAAETMGSNLTMPDLRVCFCWGDYSFIFFPLFFSHFCKEEQQLLMSSSSTVAGTSSLWNVMQDVLQQHHAGTCRMNISLSPWATTFKGHLSRTMIVNINLIFTCYKINEMKFIKTKCLTNQALSVELRRTYTRLYVTVNKSGQFVQLLSTDHFFLEINYSTTQTIRENLLYCETINPLHGLQR